MEKKKLIHRTGRKHARYNLHKSSLKPEPKRSSTTRSERVWDLKKNIEHFVRWGILNRVRPFTSAKEPCSLCLEEKKAILVQPKEFKEEREREECSCVFQKGKKLCSTSPVLGMASEVMKLESNGKYYRS